MSEYKDYGWEEGATHAHGYLYNDLKVMIGNNKNITILDIGCGNGNMANQLISENYDVYGTDGSETGISVAKKKNKDRFFVQDINSKLLPIELQDKKFDKIISTEVIEHLYNPRGYIEFCKKVLMKNGGGEMIVSTPYHGYLKNLALAVTGKFDNHFTVLWDGGHIKFWSVQTLSELLNEFGFEVIEFRGSGRLPYLWKSMFIKAKIG
jgi:2-polyprenyl-3-methyl-5-hydroxy-6-metoxy-1,4-benzoquinol methylase